MSYSFDVDNSSNYTKPSREYGVLGVNYNQHLVPLISGNPWPAMDTQYVAYPNAPNTYYSLTKENNGQPYATINSGYPGACSFYNIVKCPTNQITRPFPQDPNIQNGCGGPGYMHQPTVFPRGTATPYGGTVSPDDISCPAGGEASDPYHLIRFMNQNHFVLYADSSMSAQVISVFPPAVQAFIEVRDPSLPDVKAEMASKRISGTPVLVSSSTGLAYKGVPASFATVQQFFQAGPTIFGTGTPSPSIEGFHHSGTSMPPTYISVCTTTCPFCISLIRDVETSPMKSQFLFIDASDKATIDQHLGPKAAIAGYPLTFNLITKKSVTGYNSARGLSNLVQDLQ
jgi:hypothetical protein